MPVVSRKYLRQTLGTDWIGDTVVSSLTASVSGAVGVVGSFVLFDNTRADLTLSGQGMYARAWLHFSLRTLGQDCRVASFMVASGAFVLGGIARATPSGSEYEIHRIISPDEKDRAINDVLKRAVIRQEYPFYATQDVRTYTLAGNISGVMNAWYWSDPASSLNRSRHNLTHFEVVATSTGNELRITPSVQASYQIVLDALLTLTLGSSDVATVNIPDERWILAGAAARCYDTLMTRAPGQEAAVYAVKRRDAAREYTRLSQRFAPRVATLLQLEQPF